MSDETPKYEHKVYIHTDLTPNQLEKLLSFFSKSFTIHVDSTVLIKQIVS